MRTIGPMVWAYSHALYHLVQSAADFLSDDERMVLRWWVRGPARATHGSTCAGGRRHLGPDHR